MPLYKYAHTEEKGPDCMDEFENLQDLSEPMLTVCPDCGKPVHRVIGVFLPVKGTRALLSNENLTEKGFTKYVKAGDGYYEKTAGSGPNVISGR